MILIPACPEARQRMGIMEKTLCLPWLLCRRGAGGEQSQAVRQVGPRHLLHPLPDVRHPHLRHHPRPQPRPRHAPRPHRGGVLPPRGESRAVTSVISVVTLLCLLSSTTAPTSPTAPMMISTFPATSWASLSRYLMSYHYAGSLIGTSLKSLGLRKLLD